MTEVHRYNARCSWSGSTAAGYEGYSRAHAGDAPPAAVALELSSDPHFRGDPTLLNPEQLVVLAAASCQLLSFLAVAARARIDVVGYEDEAIGEMPERDAPIGITRIRLRPRIALGAPAAEAKVRRLVEVAHRECFVANSLRSDVVVEPTITQPADQSSSAS